MRNWVTWVQGLLLVVAIGLVAALFISGMGGPKPASNRPSPSTSPTPSVVATQAPPSVSQEKPGVPAIPIAEHETWPIEGSIDPDRQVDYKSTATPKVELPAALGGDLAAYWQQQLEWAKCGKGECATVKVPLDWDNPGKAALDIAVVRYPSKNPKNGPIFVNPGGPGIGGKAYADMLGADHWEGFDTVGWDPRGTGDSTHVVCGSTEDTDAAYRADSSPDDDAEQTKLVDAWKKFARDCRDASGELLDHITTIENVRDLDLLRFLLGGEKLNYVGVSYGTYIGAMYAELFPDRVGRLVLDSAVDITNDQEVAQVEGFELSFNNFADWCATSSECTLGDSRQAIFDKVSGFVKGLDASPLKVDDREVNQGTAVTGIAYFLYSGAEQYSTLAKVIEAAIRGNGNGLLVSADALNGRGRLEWNTEAYAFPAIRCIDSYDNGVAKSVELWHEVSAKSPLFGVNMGMEPVCETWTAKSVPFLKLTGKGAAPILVVGSTGDSATPYRHAQTMAEQLESGVLLTYDGPGHGATTNGNKCIDEAVSKYLTEGTPPVDGTTCTP